MTKEEEILEEIERFYKELYTSTTSFENTQFISYIENLELPRLEDSASSELEGDITFKECKDILSTFSRGKSPGEDGFTWEFYNCFFLIYWVRILLTVSTLRTERVKWHPHNEEA